MSLLTEFTQLEALSLPFQDAEESNSFSVLKDMERLTHLHFSVRRARHESVVEALAALTRLKSLVLRTDASSQDALSYVSHLTDLTHLAVYGPEDLYADGIIINPVASLPPVWQLDRTLSLLTKLEELRLWNAVGKAGGSSFRNLKKLKTLVLRSADVEDDLFQTLNTLPELTSLRFHVMSHNHLRLLPHVTVISGLMKLWVSGTLKQPNPCS